MNTLNSNRLASIIVYGPAASGKTRNKEAIAKAFGLSRIIDDWNRQSYTHHPPKFGCLILSHEPHPDLEVEPGIKSISIAAAKAKAGVA